MRVVILLFLLLSILMPHPAEAMNLWCRLALEEKIDHLFSKVDGELDDHFKFEDFYGSERGWEIKEKVMGGTFYGTKGEPKIRVVFRDRRGQRVEHSFDLSSDFNRLYTKEGAFALEDVTPGLRRFLRIEHEAGTSLYQFKTQREGRFGFRQWVVTELRTGVTFRVKRGKIKASLTDFEGQTADIDFAVPPELEPLIYSEYQLNPTALVIQMARVMDRYVLHRLISPFEEKVLAELKQQVAKRTHQVRSVISRHGHELGIQLEAWDQKDGANPRHLLVKAKLRKGALEIHTFDPSRLNYWNVRTFSLASLAGLKKPLPEDFVEKQVWQQGMAQIQSGNWNRFLPSRDREFESAAHHFARRVEDGGPLELVGMIAIVQARPGDAYMAARIKEIVTPSRLSETGDGYRDGNLLIHMANGELRVIRSHDLTPVPSMLLEHRFDPFTHEPYYFHPRQLAYDTRGHRTVEIRRSFAGAQSHQVEVLQVWPKASAFDANVAFILNKSQLIPLEFYCPPDL